MTTPTSPVKAGKILDTLGAMQSSMTRVGKSIAQFVMTSPHKVTQLSIADLSEEVNAGEASVIRFCRQLGYKGFQNFKMELAIELAMTDTDDNSTLLEAEIQKADDAHTIGLKLRALSRPCSRKRSICWIWSRLNGSWRRCIAAIAPLSSALAPPG